MLVLSARTMNSRDVHETVFFNFLLGFCFLNPARTDINLNHHELSRTVKDAVNAACLCSLISERK